MSGESGERGDRVLPMETVFPPLRVSPFDHHFFICKKKFQIKSEKLILLDKKVSNKKQKCKMLFVFWNKEIDLCWCVILGGEELDVYVWPLSSGQLSPLSPDHTARPVLSNVPR